MGMSTHVLGFKPPDDTWEKMKKIWDACEDAGIDPPSEVSDFFNDEEPDPNGVKVSITNHPCFSKWYDEDCEGFEIDITKLPKDIKIIRFYNSW